MSNTNTKTVAKINNVEIVVIQDGEKMVPIKPICEALEIDVDSQRKKINDDEILGSVAVLNTATGKDGKRYEMFSIPFQYVFGWLFTIDPSRVKPEAKETVIKYKLACYNALYRHFTMYAEFVEYKQKAIDAQLQICDDARHGFKNAKNVLEGATTHLNKLRKLTIDNYDAETKQFKLFTEEEQKGNAN